MASRVYAWSSAIGVAVPAVGFMPCRTMGVNCRTGRIAVRALAAEQRAESSEGRHPKVRAATNPGPQGLKHVETIPQLMSAKLGGKTLTKCTRPFSCKVQNT
jgi:hypothetical protein